MCISHSDGNVTEDNNHIKAMGDARAEKNFVYRCSLCFTCTTIANQ